MVGGSGEVLVHAESHCVDLSSYVSDKLLSDAPAAVPTTLLCVLHLRCTAQLQCKKWLLPYLPGANVVLAGSPGHETHPWPLVQVSYRKSHKVLLLDKYTSSSTSCLSVGCGL